MTLGELKQALKAAGYEIYRTKGKVVHIAERVRENLIMDANIRVDCVALSVTFFTCAQQNDFPGEETNALCERARVLGADALKRGYTERRTFVTEMTDPSDDSRILDSWHQVHFEVEVASLAAAVSEVGFALALRKTAPH